MVNYSQSWRSRSVPVGRIAYILGSATYRLLSGKCDRVRSECEVSRSVPVGRIAYPFRSAIALLWGRLHPLHHIKHLPRRVRVPECVRVASECDLSRSLGVRPIARNGCRQRFRWGNESWGLRGWEPIRTRSSHTVTIALWYDRKRTGFFWVKV
ncbi:hypothetical protein N39L_00360 [Limnospira platensis NIES-39]|nr:hypothetical protein N39L_00360 [Arthrospira platensis NIES-39]